MADAFDYVDNFKIALLNATQNNAAPEAISFLIEYGAYIHAKNQNGATALMIGQWLKMIF